MTSIALDVRRRIAIDRMIDPAFGAAVLAFFVVFARPIALLARDWWTKPDAGHGLLLAPVAIWLAWREGVREDAEPNIWLGGLTLLAAVMLRYVSGLAAELFTMRVSMLMGLGGLTIYYFGFRQLIRWWLPFVLIGLSIPLPEVILNAITLPLQFRASAAGAAMLEARHIPVRLSGNIIRIPGHELFVAEACSGLRSLTALISLSVLLGWMTLRTVIGRVLLLAVSIPVAIAINGVRVFLTGFLVYFVSPEMGKGFIHLTEGWLMFVSAFAVMGVVSYVLGFGEKLILPRPATVAVPAADAEVDGGEVANA